MDAPPPIDAGVDVPPPVDAGWDAGPPDAGRPSGCLVVAEEGPERVRYEWTPDDGPNAFEVVDALSSDAHVLVLVLSTPVDGGIGSACLAAIDRDLRPTWSMVVPAEGTLLVRIGERPHLVGIVGDQVVRREIDVAARGLGREQISPGFTDAFEWARAAGHPDGGFCVAWNQAWATYAATYAPDGSPLGPPTLLSSNGRYPHVGTDGDRFVVGYHELRSRVVTGPLVVLLDRSGTALAGPVYPDGPAGGGQDFFSERTPDGIVAAWARAGAVRFAPLTSTYMSLEEPTSVRASAPGPALGLHLLAMENTLSGTVLTYEDFRERFGGVAFVPRGNPSAASVLLETDELHYPKIGVFDDAVLTFSGGEEVSARRVDL